MNHPVVVYLPMFNATIDKILRFMDPHKMKIRSFLSVKDTIWNLGLILFPLTVGHHIVAS